jgi:Leucine-rich repeat (LRR) protein
VVTLVLGSPALVFAQIPVSEREALVVLFNSTQGESWKNSDGWLVPETGRASGPGTECDWAGVVCDENKSHVTGLSLSDFGLTGVLPSDISHLAQLETLDLSFNRLAGEIPRSLFKLRHLKRLDLAQNRFRGSLSSAQTTLPKLEFLNLRGNNLAGNIKGIARMVALVELDLADNRFEGPLPRSMTVLSKLKYLSLGGNALTGALPVEIGKLHSLEGLSLAHNRLTGIVPVQIGDLLKLQFLDLSFNRFFGRIPSSVRRLKHLRSFEADHNAFDGSFPFSVCQESLTLLNLSANQFDEQLPTDMTPCKAIQTLRLANNGFRGTIPPPFVAVMSDLEFLDLSANHFSGSIPPALDGLGRLSLLNLSDNDLTGNISQVTWPDLRVLRMDHNHLSGVIPTQLLADSLQELTLSSNELTGQLPDRLCSLASMRILDLSHNQLTGSLCDGIGALEDINVLNLSYNKIEGKIPTSITGLAKLTSLLLSNNALTGTLPSDGDPRALQVLDISFNRLTGDLPAWIGRLPIVTSVNLRSNSFSGGSSALANLKTLRHVDLRENNWSEAPAQTLMTLQNAPVPTLPIAVVDPRILETDTNLRSSNEGRSHKVSRVVPQPPEIVQMPPTPGQTESSLSGTVTDASSAAVQGVVVVAKSASTVKTTTTDSAGHYQLSLPAGEYRLSFNSPGFMETAVERVPVSVQASQGVNVTLQVGATQETVEVSSEAPQPQQGLWWNTWITRRGAAEESRVSALTSKQQKYTFYIELSGLSKHDQDKGEGSKALNQDLRKRLTELLTEGIEAPTLFVRVSVIGRAVVLSGTPNSVAEWSTIGWTPTATSTSSAVLNVDLRRLLPNVRPSAPSDANTDVQNSSLAVRGGAVRFGINALSRGCAAVAVSIWDETESIPLDQMVTPLSVDGQQGCTAELGEQQAPQTLYSEASRGIAPDVSLHVFEFTLNGQSHSASFMTLRNPIPPCDSYNWNSDATLIDLVLHNANFKDDLERARITDGIYSSLGRQIANAVFPFRNDVGTCGSAEALEALKTRAGEKDVRMFARISDQTGRLEIVPLGLLAMFEEGGQRLFAHDIRLFQPIARETLSNTECVGNWTFVLPSQLEGVSQNTLDPPVSLVRDSRVVRSRDTFVQQFVDLSPENDDPTGLLLLAHHEDGVLRFAGPGDTVVYTQFERELGQGSIAVISACETANLSDSTKLVNRLNQHGVDALVVSLFALPADFGVKFAFNFAQIVSQNQNLPIVLEDAFVNAETDTVNELSRTRGGRARGMSLELVLAGNPKLQICAPNTQAHVLSWPQ